LALVALVFVLTATARNTPADEHGNSKSIKLMSLTLMFSFDFEFQLPRRKNSQK
jgi:hypothetical protein